ncbi:MAG: lipopolysaccharide biosynthesis protein [Sphingobacteriaceae bacterium]|nr:MAG: lipopolysaccharide biosynthesis protein [Sphingobacteriaceae bacterium]
MELNKFLQLLYRHRFILIAVPVIAFAVTYLLVKNLPDQYVSQTDLSTGIIDPSKQVLGDEKNGIQESQVNQKFSNLLSIIRLSKVMDQVSYSLIIHDLTDSHPFRPKSKLLKQLNPTALAHALSVYQTKYRLHEPLNLNDIDEAGLNRVLAAQHYDEESLKKDLLIYRSESSDFIHLTFTSEQPQLSAFVLNTLCSEFISYNTADQQSDKINANRFLQKLVLQKQDSMNAKVAALRNYKIKNQILDLKDQSTLLYSQLNDYRDKRLQAEKDILSYNSAIANISSRFDPKDRRYLEASSSKLNVEVAQTRDNLASVNNKYVQSNFNPRYKKSSDSLQHVLDEQLNQVSDKYAVNPLAGKENLVQEKVKMEISRDMSRSGLRNLDNQIGQLNNQLKRIVPFDAAIQSYERDIEVATKEYTDVENKYNQSSIEADVNSTIKQVEIAMPGTMLPSKKLFLVLLSAVLSTVFCLVVLFILFLTDQTIRMPLELANATQIPVLGQLNLIRAADVDFKRIGINRQSTIELQQFKNLLRSIRYEIDQELHQTETAEGMVLAVTSLNAKEGKSLVVMSLASAYAMTNKKVLVVDGNFNNPSLTLAAAEKVYLEDFLAGDDLAIRSPEDNLISMLGNSGGEQSLLEKSTENNIRSKIDLLKKNFDVVIIETEPLNLMNKAKEWILFADKVIAVFEANQSIDHNKKLHIGYLKNLGDKLIGLIMNKVIAKPELEVKQV